eukprot:1195820-Prorocentrum_minimum.AAC.1
MRAGEGRECGGDSRCQLHVARRRSGVPPQARLLRRWEAHSVTSDHIRSCSFVSSAPMSSKILCTRMLYVYAKLLRYVVLSLNENTSTPSTAAPARGTFGHIQPYSVTLVLLAAPSHHSREDSILPPILYGHHMSVSSPTRSKPIDSDTIMTVGLMARSQGLSWRASAPGMSSAPLTWRPTRGCTIWTNRARTLSTGCRWSLASPPPRRRGTTTTLRS